MNELLIVLSEDAELSREDRYTQQQRLRTMTNTDTRDPQATLAQIARLEARGCEAVRVAVPDEAAVAALPAIRAGTRLPLIADIHFDYRLAVASLEAGLEGLRINPGNIGPREHAGRHTVRP